MVEGVSQNNSPVMQQTTGRSIAKSSLYPFLWALPIAIACFYLAPEFDDKDMKWALIICGIALIVLFVGAALFFLIKDPKELHTEEHQLNMRRLDYQIAYELGKEPEPLVIDQLGPNANVASNDEDMDVGGKK
jgi:hypothetical protein